MNPQYLGDSYDLVKRFFCGELASLGYVVAIDPMLTGAWNGIQHEFYRFVGVNPEASKQIQASSTRHALFLDPDTGVRERGGTRHVSYDRLVQEASNFELVFSFDQSFSRQANPESLMREKLAAIHQRGCHAMYYDSHARFLFAASQKASLHQLRGHLVSLGLPASRLLENGT